MTEHATVYSRLRCFTYGHLKLFRAVGEDAGNAPHAGTLPPLTGVSETSHELPVARAAPRVYNIACVATFDLPAEQGIHEEIQQKLSTPVRIPWTSNLVNTMLGNLWYQRGNPSIQVRGMRSLQNVKELAQLVHRGELQETLLERFGVDYCLGRHLQVSQNGYLEYLVRRLFAGEVKIVQRTEEQNNAVLLHLPDVGPFLERAGVASAAHGMLLGAHASMLVTKTGHVKLRLTWKTPRRLHPRDDFAAIEREILETTSVLTGVLYSMC